jgi:lysophospholipase
LANSRASPRHGSLFARPYFGRYKVRPSALFSPMPLISTPDNPVPPGAIEEYISAADGVRLRTARWTPTSAIGTVVVLGGRGEFLEKYFEVTGELLARGFAVASMDWRGQGGSDRPLRDARKGHVGDFRQFEADLVAFTEKILELRCPRPWIGLCHSMGAAVLLGASESGRSPFDRLVLISPMVAVMRVNHRGLTGLAIAALANLGMGRAFAPGGARPSIWLSPFAGNVLTSDERRFARIARLVAASPDLTLGGPTIGWTRAAFRHMRRLDDLKSPTGQSTPMLIVAAGADRVTDTDAAKRLASRLDAAQFVAIDGSQHEILIERDDLRAQFWAAFDQFVPAPASKPPQPTAPREI